MLVEFVGVHFRDELFTFEVYSKEVILDEQV